MTEEINKPLFDVLLNTFLINKKYCHVLLERNKIVWQKNGTNTDKTTILIDDIITVKLNRCKTFLHRTFCSTFILKGRTSNHNSDETPTTDNNNFFLSIYYGKRLADSRKNYNIWRKCTINLYNNDYEILRLWYDRMTMLINEQNRPKNILMFINPFGGKKQALRLYKKFSKPIMNLAKIDVSCIISQRRNQIHDIIMTQTLDLYDAVCCVGGDGTFAEVFNGLIFRAIKDLNMDPLRPNYIPKPKIPIGIIPAGSTNTVAYCMHGTTDIETAIIHIVLGQTRGLDLSSFCNNNGLIRFYASVMSYGYLGDVAMDSEKFRWMGPRRYDYSGFKKIFANAGYESEITYLSQSENDDQCKTKCTVDCTSCLNAQKEDSKNKQNNFNCNYGTDDLKKQETCGTSTLKTEKLKSNEWKNVKGNFFMISSTNICCASSRSLNGLSPYCHLSDGYINIVLVRHTNVINNIRLLLTLVNQNGDIANLPFVEIYRTQKFHFRIPKLLDEENINFSGSFQPISNSNENNDKISQWNCDGEVLHATDLFINSHCQIIDVFMRGPYLRDDTTNASRCANLF